MQQEKHWFFSFKKIFISEVVSQRNFTCYLVECCFVVHFTQ